MIQPSETRGRVAAFLVGLVSASLAHGKTLPCAGSIRRMETGRPLPAALSSCPLSDRSDFYDGHSRPQDVAAMLAAFVGLPFHRDSQPMLVAKDHDGVRKPKGPGSDFKCSHACRASIDQSEKRPGCLACHCERLAIWSLCLDEKTLARPFGRMVRVCLSNWLRGLRHSPPEPMQRRWGHLSCGHPSEAFPPCVGRLEAHASASASAMRVARPIFLIGMRLAATSR